jgi:predicted nucleotidyltransferase component of viral defense system
MLTKAQIQRLAQRHGVGMQVQERDYLQHLLLWRLYSRSQELVFKGGTALRLVYRGNLIRQPRLQVDAGVRVQDRQGNVTQ